MKNGGLFSSTVMAFLILLISATGAFAENREGAINVTPFIGGFNFDRDLPMANNWVYGAALGYNFTERLGAEFAMSYTDTSFDGEDFVTGSGMSFNTQDASMMLYRLELLFHLTGILPGDMVVPFLAAGGGLAQYDTSGGAYDETDTVLDYGGGVKVFLTRNMALRADIRQVVDMNGGDTYNNLLYTAGMCFEFGGKGREAEVVAPLDSDGDGVTDDMDRCPDTPAGSVVDEWGCVKPIPVVPVDSDGDGVTDDLDKCPNTPKGTKVDANGCPPPVDQGAIIFRNINFDLGKATLKEESYPILDEVTDYLKTNTGVKMEIQGHTCNLGSAALNQRLSDERANTVKDYLVKNGIAADRLSAKGYGLTKPVAPNDTEENRKRNRRVEFAPMK